MNNTDTEIIDWIQAAADRVPVQSDFGAVNNLLNDAGSEEMRPEGTTVGPLGVPAERPKRNRTPILMAMAGVVAGIVGFGLYNQAPGLQTAATEPDTTAQTAEVEAPAADPEPPTTLVSPHLTDTPPEGLELATTHSAADYAEPVSVRTTQTYAIEGKPRPDVGDPQLTITWFQVDDDSGLFGEPLEIRGRDGYSVEDAIKFVENGFEVWLWSPTLATDELVTMANGLEIGPSGPAPVQSPPGDLVPLSPTESHIYEPHAATVPPHGHTATYSDPGDPETDPRDFVIFVSPLEDEARFFWSFHGEEILIGDRLVLFSADDEAVIARWVEGEAMISVLGLSVSKEEVFAAIEGIRPANPTEW